MNDRNDPHPNLKAYLIHDMFSHPKPFFLHFYHIVLCISGVIHFLQLRKENVKTNMKEEEVREGSEACGAEDVTVIYLSCEQRF